MRSVRPVIRYRMNQPPREMLRGLRVFDPRTGWVVYTGEAVFTRGGYTDRNVGPRFLPRENRIEP